MKVLFLGMLAFGAVDRVKLLYFQCGKKPSNPYRTKKVQTGRRKVNYPLSPFSSSLHFFPCHAISGLGQTLPLTLYHRPPCVLAFRIWSCTSDLPSGPQIFILSLRCTILSFVLESASLHFCLQVACGRLLKPLIIWHSPPTKPSPTFSSSFLLSILFIYHSIFYVPLY